MFQFHKKIAQAREIEIEDVVPLADEIDKGTGAQAYSNARNWIRGVNSEIKRARYTTTSYAMPMYREPHEMSVAVLAEEVERMEKEMETDDV